LRQRYVVAGKIASASTNAVADPDDDIPFPIGLATAARGDPSGRQSDDGFGCAVDPHPADRDSTCDCPAIVSGTTSTPTATNGLVAHVTGIRLPRRKHFSSRCPSILAVSMHGPPRPDAN
jgi:hypothetical protein